jgi:hypothetical protein
VAWTGSVWHIETIAVGADNLRFFLLVVFPSGMVASGEQCVLTRLLGSVYCDCYGGVINLINIISGAIVCFAGYYSY